MWLFQFMKLWPITKTIGNCMRSFGEGRRDGETERVVSAQLNGSEENSLMRLCVCVCISMYFNQVHIGLWLLLAGSYIACLLLKHSDQQFCLFNSVVWCVVHIWLVSFIKPFRPIKQLSIHFQHVGWLCHHGSKHTFAVDPPVRLTAP